MVSSPSKSDIEAIFNRLRATASNKTCFDCNAKNPTWATVTYGVFICIDCSAVHRSLGVHLTFVRSTNLDTNWTWTQIRQMQLGGNANASQFFRQHNCNTTDAQQKYNSRAAQLYRDKLANAAQQAMKTFGCAVFIDGTGASVADEKQTPNEEEDFFAECANDNVGDGFVGGGQTSVNNNKNVSAPVVPDVAAVPPPKTAEVPAGAPSVDFLNFVGDQQPTEVKSTIGVRKIQSKRNAAAVKKAGGLGATKVKTNFADLEQRANLADQQKFAVPEAKTQTEEERNETYASVRLAYQDLSLQAKKEEEKLRQTDPAKAKQMERLGMGFNHRSGVSHSALTEMTTISQQAATPSKYSSAVTAPATVSGSLYDDFYDEYLGNGGGGGSNSSSSGSRIYSSKVDRDLDTMGFELIEPANSNVSTMFSPNMPKVKEQQPSAAPKPSFSSSQQQRTSAKVTPGGTKYNTYEAEDAQKKFGGAKAISSDQFFNKETTTFERSANMAKFQGSNSISSAEYFGDGPSVTGRGNRNNYSGPDMDDVRESVRHGVTKVAGRLSSIANDMMSSLQDKYGG